MSHDPRCAVEKLVSEGLSPEDAMEAIFRKEDDQLAKHGWLVHYVFDDADTPWGVNVHSHGVAENFGHPDFQIVVVLSPEVAQDVLYGLVEEVKAGRVFSAGTTASGILRGYDVGFADAVEDGREVLRVIIPDPEGRTARGEIDRDYGVQYEGTK